MARTDDEYAIDEITAELLGLIRSGRAQSRAQLGQLSGFARATVASRLDLLLSADLVKFDEFLRGTGGRPASRLVLNARRGVLLGADIGGSHTRVAVYDLHGETLAVSDHVIDVNDGPRSVLGLVGREFDLLVSSHGFAATDVLGIAIGLPGPIEQATGRVVRPPTMRGWDGADVRGIFRRRYPRVPVAVDKDANIMAVGEYHALADPPPDVLLLKVGMGIGGGIIANGQVVRGGQGAAGDLGHLPRTGGAPCRCGQDGCAEATAGGWAIAHELRAAGFSHVRTSQDIVDLVRDGQPTAVALLHRAGQRLGEVLSEAIGVLNPSVIVVGGNLAVANDDLLNVIRHQVATHSHPLATKGLRIELGVLGRDAGIRGAGRLAADAAFEGEALAALLT
ncbi:ROK family protein [Microbacterium koreense]|uniref:ROK family protein n=1 Tax=Microbacterium koreense TaxID=323761 RepID=A0ABW2ZTK2_9MICO